MRVPNLKILLIDKEMVIVKSSRKKINLQDCNILDKEVKAIA